MQVPQTLENAARRLEAQARRHRRGDNVSAAAVRESARLLSNRMILAGRQSRLQVSRLRRHLHLRLRLCWGICVCLGMLLLFSQHLFSLPLPADCLVLHADAMPQAGTPTPVWSSLAQEDDSPSDGSDRVENSASPLL